MNLQLVDPPLRIEDFRWHHNVSIKVACSRPAYVELLAEFAMATEAGWESRRRAIVQIGDAAEEMRVLRAVIVIDTSIVPEGSFLRVKLVSMAHNSEVVCRALGPTPGRVSLKLLPQAPEADPVGTFVRKLTGDALTPGSMGAECIDAVYENQLRFSLSLDDVEDAPTSIRLTDGRELALRNEQIAAVKLGISRRPIAAFNACYGAGKTLMAAVTAKLLAERG